MLEYSKGGYSRGLRIVRWLMDDFPVESFYLFISAVGYSPSLDWEEKAVSELLKGSSEYQNVVPSSKTIKMVKEQSLLLDSLKLWLWWKTENVDRFIWVKETQNRRRSLSRWILTISHFQGDFYQSVTLKVIFIDQPLPRWFLSINHFKCDFYQSITFKVTFINQSLSRWFLSTNHFQGGFCQANNFNANLSLLRWFLTINHFLGDF